MMRKLFWVATVLFWLAVATITLVARQAPPPTPAAQPTPVFTLQDVAQHASDQDCWMVIAGTVYDISAYVPEHPSRPSILLPWCGKEATEAYRTKGKGRPHSAQADALLAPYAIGTLGGPTLPPS